MRYYIPTPDEFCQGFEYEFCLPKVSSEYHQRTMSEPLWLWWTDKENPTEVRVKYLDIDDIIDLGFTIKYTADDITTLMINIPSAQPLYYNLTYELIQELPYVCLSDMYNHPLITGLHLKNKSELKWLLNRYGIFTN